MVVFYEQIPPNIIDWIKAQHLFWVATAPLSADGHINISPKGLRGTFHIVNPNQVWYEDITGSGIETISHVRENGRIVVQFNAFDGPPRIVRLWGREGTVHEFGTPEFERYLPADERHPGARSAIVIDVHKVSSSCGYGVPYYEFAGQRETLTNWTGGLERREQEHAAARVADGEGKATPSHAEKGLIAYWMNTNMKSIDGLPGMQSAHRSGKVPDSRLVRIEEAKRNTEGVGKGGKATAEESMASIVAQRKGESVRLLVGFLLGLAVADVYARYAGRMMELAGALMASA